MPARPRYMKLVRLITIQPGPGPQDATSVVEPAVVQTRCSGSASHLTVPAVPSFEIVAVQWPKIGVHGSSSKHPTHGAVRGWAAARWIALDTMFGESPCASWIDGSTLSPLYFPSPL